MPPKVPHCLICIDINMASAGHGGLFRLAEVFRFFNLDLAVSSDAGIAESGLFPRCAGRLGRDCRTFHACPGGVTSFSHLPTAGPRVFHCRSRDSWRRVRNLVDLPCAQDIAESCATALQQQGCGAGELQEEPVAPDCATRPGAYSICDVGEELVGVPLLNVLHES